MRQISPTVESVDEARRILAEVRDLSMKLHSNVNDERLLGQRSAPPWGGPARTLFQHCNEMVWHLGQHKGQLFYYLKLQGKPVKPTTCGRAASSEAGWSPGSARRRRRYWPWRSG